jgi:hypothetical protein
MSAHPPPVPPANRSPKGPGSDPGSGESEAKTVTRPDDTAERDRQGEIHQNTHNQGFQQDR